MSRKKFSAAALAAVILLTGCSSADNGGSAGRSDTQATTTATAATSATETAETAATTTDPFEHFVDFPNAGHYPEPDPDLITLAAATKLPEYEEWAVKTGYPEGTLAARGDEGIINDYFHTLPDDPAYTSGSIVVGDSRCCQLGIYEKKNSLSDFATFAVWGGHYNASGYEYTEMYKYMSIVDDTSISDIENCFREQIKECGKCDIYFFATVNDYDYKFENRGVINRNSDYTFDAISKAEKLAALTFEYEGQTYHPNVVVVGLGGCDDDKGVIGIEPMQFNRYVGDYNEWLTKRVGWSDYLRINAAYFTTVQNITGKTGFLADGLSYDDATLGKLAKYISLHNVGKDRKDAEAAKYSLSHEGYELEQVVVLSRHNIRSPLSSKDSILGQATPYEWFEWSSNPSELSMRGGAAETLMGQYFRKWLEKEGLFPENYMPGKSDVRFYSNSKQRTIATSNYFKAGLLPVGDVPTEYHMEIDEMDPVFNPQLTFVNDAYVHDINTKFDNHYSLKIKELEDNFLLLSDVIDLERSPAYADGTLTGFATDDTELILEKGKEPGMTGSLKTGCSLSDALVLQYYEQPDDLKAAFGRDLRFDDWKKISEIKDVYGDILFTMPLVAPNVAHPLLEEISKELNTSGRKFTFLCGHDSNVGSVLAALDVVNYTLPETIESKTPIGCKIVIGKWRGKDGREYISCDLVYQRSQQLRDMSLLDLQNTPASCALTFRALDRNKDGLFKAEDFMKRLEDSIAEYDRIAKEYHLSAAA